MNTAWAPLAICGATLVAIVRRVRRRDGGDRDAGRYAVHPAGTTSAQRRVSGVRHRPASRAAPALAGATLTRPGLHQGKLALYLLLCLGWSMLVGLVLFLAGVRLSSGVGIAVVAVLYMPSPFVAALIAERGLVRSRFALPGPGWRSVTAYLGIPVLVVVVFAVAFVGTVLVGGDLLGLAPFGTLASTEAEIKQGAAALLGQAAVEAAGPPPPFPVLLVAGISGAAVAGWTVNGLFAMGEEYGWRGLMWEELERHGMVKANVLIGTVWGLWHAPLILQGYNYPGQPLLGAVAMVIFCIGMSFALTAMRRRTASVIPVAAAHGAFNALAPVLLILAPGTTRVLTGPLGVTGAVILALIGGSLAHRRAEARTASGDSFRRHHTMKGSLLDREDPDAN